MTRIKLDRYYQNTNGVKLTPGEYDAGDLPKGLAAYLVQTDHAVIIEGEADEPVDDTSDNETDSPQGDLPAYTSLTKDEWLAYADEHGLAIDATADDSKQAVYDAIVEVLG